AQSEFSLAELLDETIALYDQQFSSRGIRVIKDYRSAGTVLGRRGEIQQVFSNLTSNAIDAMNGGGGALTVRVTDVRNEHRPGGSGPGRRYRHGYFRSQPGEGVRALLHNEAGHRHRSGTLGVERDHS